MTKEDKDEIREIMESYIATVTAQNDSKFDMINLKLDLIKEQTTKTNGRVNKLEEKEQNHITNCPNINKIRTLEDNQLTVKAIRKWVLVAMGVTATVISMVGGIIAIILKFVH